MCWDVDIVHQNNAHLADADYWSQLSADICFDPLFKSYLDFDRGLCEWCPAPTSLPMKPENMPYYCSPGLPVGIRLQGWIRRRTLHLLPTRRTICIAFNFICDG
jgi:hypothetical protein